MPSYFAFEQEDPKGRRHEFIFALEDEAKVLAARTILADPHGFKKAVSGTIVERPVWYNPGWSFHLAPDSIGFFELAAEVCDANVTWVEEHLGEIGGSALPQMFWCPWSSRLVREVFPSRPPEACP